MKSRKYFQLVVVVLIACGVLMMSFYVVVRAAPLEVMQPRPTAGALTAIDVSLDAQEILESLGIYYQDEPRFGYWRAAATIDQLAMLRQEGVGYEVAGKVAIIEGNRDQAQASTLVPNECLGNNNGDYNITDDWVYAPIWTNCPGAGTVDYVDIYYDVIHQWADNALALNIGSSSPTWGYVNLEGWDDCSAPVSPDWHKWQYNIINFHGRQVNQRWDLVARDYCPGEPNGYIDHWSIWVYYTLPPLPADGSFLSQEIVISERVSNEYNPAVAYNPVHHEYLVVWENEFPGGYHDIYAQRLSSTGKLLSWFDVSTSLNSNYEPAVAYDPVNDRYLVVFTYDFNGDGSNIDVYGRFIPWNGPDPGLTDFIICDWSTDQQHAEVTYAYEQREYLAVWKNAPDDNYDYISGRRIIADGSGMPDAFAISSGPENRDFVDVTYNLTRNEYLVVWDVDMSESSRSWDIFGRRFQGNGIPIGEEFNIAGWPGGEMYPSVAACRQADQYLVAWESDHETGGDDYAIYARYLNGDAVPGTVYIVNDGLEDDNRVDVRCNFLGNKYLLAWEHQITANIAGIWARIAFPDETMPPAFEVIPAGWDENRLSPAIGGGRSSYLVTWAHETVSGNYDIHGRLLRHVVYLPLTNRLAK